MNQVTTFSDSAPGYDCGVVESRDATFSHGTADSSNFKEFMSRPVLLRTIPWTIGSPLNVKINPWAELIQDPHIANRINNFRGIRCDIKVRFVVNGGPFYYGRAMASYCPLTGVNSLIGNNDFYSATSLFGDTVTASQRPHIFIDPTTNQGGELTLPFFYPANALDKMNQADIDSMGEVWIRALTALAHANSLSGTVNISVLAWMENVELVGVTSFNQVGLVAQSGQDEYNSTGAVSKPASIMKNMSSRLASVPVIGPYMRATELASGAVEAIARLFGYSRPRSVENQCMVLPDYGGNLANCNVTDYSTSFGVDVKQEVTIDPRTVGLDSTDEMDITYLCAKESIVATTDWPSSAAAEDVLLSVPISPGAMYWKANSAPDVPVFQTPMCWLSQAFSYWSGTISVRIQVASSSMHKGRLLVTWDAYDDLATGYPLNTVYNRIVDISEERDFTVDIGWGSLTSFLKQSFILPNDVNRISSTTITTNEPSTDNGVLTVRVLNPVTVPDGSVDNISLIVSVSSPDMAFRDPTTLQFMSYFPLIAQSGQANYDGMDAPAVEEKTEDPARPERDSAVVTFSDPKVNIDNVDGIFFGETIRSMRTLLKRYHGYEDVSYQTASAFDTQLCWVGRNTLPRHKGVVAGASTATDMTMLTYMLPAYAGWRGAVRHKVMPQYTETNTLQDTYHEVLRLGNGLSIAQQALFQQSAFAPPSFNQFASVGAAGMLAQPEREQPFFHLEMPYYSNYRFGNAKNADQTLCPDSFQYGCYLKGDGTNFGVKQVRFFAAAGEDFNLFFFTGVPGMLFS